MEDQDSSAEQLTPGKIRNTANFQSYVLTSSNTRMLEKKKILSFQWERTLCHLIAFEEVLKDRFCSE